MVRAARILNDAQSLEKDIKAMIGCFDPNGSGAPLNVAGKGFSVVRTSTGLFTVTMQDAWFDVKSIQLTLRLATPDDKFLQLGTVTFGVTSPTFQIRVFDASGAALADVAAATGNTICFTVWADNSTL